MTNKYTESLRLSAIIDHNPQVLMVMSRFKISLGFGDKTVAEICRSQNVDCNTFLAVANFISFDLCDTQNVSLSALMDYLDNAHTYFLDFCLPMIRNKLIEAIQVSANNDLYILIIKYFDEYVEEIRRHMAYETNTVFGYVRNLLAGHKADNFSIDRFASQHHSIHDRLNELKDIIIRYLPQHDSNLLNVVLFDIINCEHDLMTHCRVEDRIFVPEVRRVEDSINAQSLALNSPDTFLAESNTDDPISERERDIIECVAHGLSNKEIADRLCISVNTVTTHRRNIAQKLHIHSPAGLTIYAVVNGIVKLEDLKNIL